MYYQQFSPRNIQFQDAVEIREIPSHPEVYMPMTWMYSEAPWDPNLTDTQVLEPKPSNPFKKIVIGITVGGVVLLAIVIGVVLGLALSQKTNTVAANSLGYGQSCTVGSNQCISSLGLTCTGGLCICPAPYSWNTVTGSCTLLTYNQACSAVYQCNSSLGLNCTNSVCQCDSVHIWSTANNLCTAIPSGNLSYGASCAVGGSQCNSTAGLNCTGNCTCSSPQIWNISSCVCPAGTFLNASNLCETARTFNQTCVVGSNQCDSTKSLLCNSSLCQCDDSKNYWNLNYQMCLPRVNYSGYCTYDTDCIPTLICPTTVGVCTCPLYLPDLVCNCANTKYYNGTQMQCLNRSTFGGSCLASANYTCLTTLYCNAGTCACPTGTVWIAANSTCVASG